MAHNFRLTGNIYVSKDGSDANAGTSPDAPKLTLAAGVGATGGAGTLIVGTGVYSESFTRATNLSITIIADGYVVFDGQSIRTISGNGTSSVTTITFKDIVLQYYASISISGGTNAGVVFSFSGCTLISCHPRATGGSSNNYSALTMNTCVLINSSAAYNHGNQSGSYSTYGSSIFINSVISGYITGITNCYFDSTSLINNSVNVLPAASFNYNNIQGKILMTGGTYSGIGVDFNTHRTYYSSYNVNSISLDPKFNDLKNLNFTLQADSPHIFAASDYRSNIGGTQYAKHYTANSTELTSGATITNLTLMGDNSYVLSTGIIAGSFVVGYQYVIVSTGTTDFTLIGAADSNPGTVFTATGVGTGTGTANAVDGNIITAPLFVQNYPGTKPLTGIIWTGSLEFNKSVSGGQQRNQNVPAYDTYTTGGGASPDRLKIKMRYSTQSAQPTAGQWNNGGYWAVDTYQLMEVNLKPKVDSQGIGNGDYTYIEFTGLGDFVPTWIQLDIKLRNDYNP